MLPPELVSNILTKTHKSSVYECMFVCKAWYTVASRVYYKQAELVLDHLTFLKITQMQRIDGSFLGDHVRNLVFLYKDQRGRTTRTGDFIENPYKDLVYLDSNQFHALIAHLPYLETIQFNAPCTVPSSNYLKYLKDVPRTHLPGLQDLILPVLSDPTCSAIKQDYMCNVSRSFNTMKRLYLDHFESTSHLLSLLSKMPQLQDLTLDNRIGGVKDLDVVSVLNACHDLHSLTMVEFNNNTTTSKVKYHPNLTRFCLTGSTMTNDLVHALVTGIPAHIQFCQIDMKHQSLMQWISETNTAARFAHHIKHTQQLKLTMSGASTDEQQGFWEFTRCLAMSRKTHLEFVVFDESASVQSIRVHQSSVHVQLVSEDLDVDFSAASSVHVTSHVANISVGDVVGVLDKKLSSSKQPEFIRIQCHSGSLYADSKSIHVDREWVDVGGLAALYPTLEKFTCSLVGSGSLALDSFKYVHRIRVDLGVLTGVCLKFVKQSSTVSHYYCHDGQVVPCSGNMVSPVMVEISLCRFQQLDLVFENKVVHTFYFEFM